MTGPACDCGGRIERRGPLGLCGTCGTWQEAGRALTDDDQASLNERAAIREYDALETRTDAEINAALEYAARNGEE